MSSGKTLARAGEELLHCVSLAARIRPPRRAVWWRTPLVLLVSTTFSSIQSRRNIYVPRCSSRIAATFGA